MNLIRIHYVDGTVDSFRGVPRLVKPIRPIEDLVAMTDEKGTPVSAVQAGWSNLARWSAEALASQKFASNMATARAAARDELVSYRPSHFIVDEEDLDPPSLEAKPRIAWPILGLALVLAILASMIGQAVGGAG